MAKAVTFCLIAIALACVYGQSTPTSNDTSTDSPDDIYSLDEEDFKLWIAGRTPKAWETSTRRVITSTQSTPASDDNRLLSQFDSSEPVTPQELSVTPIPNAETTPKTDGRSETQGYLYPRPGNLQNWLQSHMLQSHQINNQLMADVSALPYPPRYVGAVPDCIPASEAFNFRPASASFQTLATIHRFHDNVPSQPLPFPGNSHHGDAFLSQHQHQQKPPQQQQQQPTKPEEPQQQHQLQPSVAPARQQGHRITEFHGNPHFFHPPQAPYSSVAIESPPLVYGFY
ncbi:uncharacterized protein LOC109426622 [Aedes albopictus]|uniref:Uncharacterized protein n=1 Tax=Aedes albopictus TaxID=7160 RepID=A0ABM1ZIL3_AEDAL